MLNALLSACFFGSSGFRILFENYMAFAEPNWVEKLTGKHFTESCACSEEIEVQSDVLMVLHDPDIEMKDPPKFCLTKIVHFGPY